MAMTLKSRAELEIHFKNGQRPSQSHFAELIGSTLNKRDDQILGRWRAGTTYRAGDVVVHERALWELWPPPGEPEEICSHHPPGGDEEPWRSLIVAEQDGDWFIVDLDVESSGTEAAEAVEDDPEARPATMHANPRVLRVGIGTEEPGARLDVRAPESARLAFAAGEPETCALSLVELEGDAALHHLSLGVAGGEAYLTTDADEGLVIRTADPFQAFCESDALGELLVAVKPDGRVGIGTDQPYTRLEVTNCKSGRFLFNLDRKVNPAFSIVNRRPGYRENYLASGVDNDVAMFVTDSEYGFLFRAGGESGTDDHEIDINQGRELVSILPEGSGKLGIGRQPEDYQLDVNGLGRSFGSFIDTDERHLEEVEPLGEVLSKLRDLRPVSFEWSPATGLGEAGTQIGLVAHEVDDFFPEAVKTNRDRSKAVAYHALVPVLIKAVQDQQAQIESLEERVAALESEAKD